MSIQDRLKAPDPSDVSRQRKLSVNTGGNRPAKSASSVQLQSSLMNQTDFSKETALMLNVKKSNLISHISSKKHKFNKEKLEKSKKRDVDIGRDPRRYDNEHHPRERLN